MYFKKSMPTASNSGSVNHSWYEPVTEQMRAKPRNRWNWYYFCKAVWLLSHSKMWVGNANRKTIDLNCRMVKVGRDNHVSSGPISLPKQGILKYIAQDCVQICILMNISSEGYSTSSLGNLFQCWITCKVKEFCLMFRWNFHIHQFLPIASCLIDQHHGEEPGSIFLTSSLQILRDIDKSEGRFLIQFWC